MAQKAVFLDRDDTLIDDPGYIKHPDQVRLLPGASEALIMLREMGYLLVVVTNQSAVARGMITEEQLEDIHKRFRNLLSTEGASIDALYFCPYHPEGVVKDYNMESNLRKPNAGMFFQAEEELDIDLSQSWMIGDSYRDIEAGKAAGCHTILVDVPGKIREKKDTDPEPDRSAVNLRETVNIIRMYEFHQKAQAARKAAQTDPQTNPLGQPESRSSNEPADPQDNSDDEPEDFNSTTPSDAPKEELVLQEEPAVCSVAVLPKTESEETPENEPQIQPLLQPDPDTDFDVEQRRIEKLRQARPDPIKFYTAKDRGEINRSANSDSEDKTHHLLEEILHQLKHRDRESLYQDFSVYKLLSLMLEVISVFCLIVSVFFWLSPNPNKSFDQVLIMIGYAAALQIMVIALLMMDSRD